jgi:hypothetical protein
MSGLISQNGHPSFAEDLLSFQLYSLYSLISLRCLEMKTDIHSPLVLRRPEAEVNIPAKEANEANEADSKGFNLRNKLAQIAKKGPGSGEPAQTEKGLVSKQIRRIEL